MFHLHVPGSEIAFILATGKRVKLKRRKSDKTWKISTGILIENSHRHPEHFPWNLTSH
jgi:hypothetical protein